MIQGVGYPNPDRSHFESMDIWQLADPKRAQTSGWLARTIPGMSVNDAGVPGMFIGEDRLPVALQGADGGVISLADRASFQLQLSGNEKSRKSLIEDLNSRATGPRPNSRRSSASGKSRPTRASRRSRKRLDGAEEQSKAAAMNS